MLPFPLFPSLRDARDTAARDLRQLFGATSYASVVDSDEPGRYNVSVTFGGLNDEELQTVATIGFRNHGFSNLTADEVRTLRRSLVWKSFAGRIGSCEE